VNGLGSEAGQGLKVYISAEVVTQVQVERGLASAYRLRPPLHVAPRFRDKNKRRDLRQRDRVT
jgi:hypothetical protein